MFMCFRYMNEIRYKYKNPEADRYTQSRLPTLRFAMSMSCCASAAKKLCGLSAAANAPQISVGYTIDCLVSISPGI